MCSLSLSQLFSTLDVIDDFIIFVVVVIIIYYYFLQATRTDRVDSWRTFQKQGKKKKKKTKTT